MPKFAFLLAYLLNTIRVYVSMAKKHSYYDPSLGPALEASDLCGGRFINIVY